MDDISFPFAYIHIPRIGRFFIPVVQIQLRTVVGLAKFNFIVDTGADFTTLPLFMAEKLGIDLDKCERSQAEGLGGHVVKTWLTKIELIMSTNSPIKVRASITNENSTPFLLGRIDCLDVLYSWNFNATRKQIEFTKI